ncbi:hypothetical protein NQZ79_g2524 [Umbelopsis isabellina]|nr:hypothetical protein NQZ79_g2524 [Umbelopsis isabellina]
MHLPRTLSLVALSFLSLVAAQNVSIALPASIPANATLLDPRLCSMSLEFQSLEYFAGDLDIPNQFTHYLFKIGRSHWTATGSENEHITIHLYLQTGWPLATQVCLIPCRCRSMWVLISSSWPKTCPRTMVTFGANLKFNNISDAVDEAIAIMNAFPGGKAGSVILERLESEMNQTTMGISKGSIDYAASLQMDRICTKYHTSLEFYTGQRPMFSSRDYGGYSTNWTLTDLLKTDIVSGASGTRINTVAQHNYMGDGATGTIQMLLDKPFVRSKLGIFKPDIVYANSKGYNHILVPEQSLHIVWPSLVILQFVLSRVMSIITLQHITLQHTTSGSPLVALSLVTLPPPNLKFILNYHAFLVVAEAIGNTGKSRIAEIYVGSNHVSAYTIWENGALARIVVINQEPWTFASTGARPITTVKLQGLNSKNATYKSLYIPYADVADGMTWVHQSFTTNSGLPSGNVVSQKVKNGQIDTLATSVNLITLQ